MMMSAKDEFKEKQTSLYCARSAFRSIYKYIILQPPNYNY